ncbi:chaplin [Streptomyces sp. NPDC004065]|uniref:chaplin n=1 Tax=Streptomyces sp. NPDC004065 TaxID=3364689 RepID=UPI00384AABF6
MSLIAKAGIVTLGTGAVVLSGAGLAAAGAGAEGAALNSRGLASGNVIQVPVHAPINVCHNTVRVAGLLNPAVGNVCKKK